MAYALLLADRARFLTAAALAPDRKLTTLEAASLMQTSNHLGRLRRRLGDGGGGWLDEAAEEQSESFLQWIDGLSEDDLRNEAVIIQIKQIANELADAKQGDRAAWLTEIDRRLENAGPDQQ